MPKLNGYVVLVMAGETPNNDKQRDTGGEPMFDLSKFIAACLAAVQLPDAASIVQQRMSEALVDPRSMTIALSHYRSKNAAIADYAFLHQSPELTIMHVVLPGLLRSPPHNHLVWAVIGMYEGSEKNIFYRRENNHLFVDSERTLSAPEVMTLAPNAIHGISNPSSRPSHALHVYGGLLSNPARSLWNPRTLEEGPFQLSTLQQYEREINR